MIDKVKGLEAISELGLPVPPYAIVRTERLDQAQLKECISRIGVPKLLNDRWGIVIRLSSETMVDKGLPHSRLHIIDETQIEEEARRLWVAYGPFVTMIFQHTVDAKCSGVLLKLREWLVETIPGDAPALLNGESTDVERWEVYPSVRQLSNFATPHGNILSEHDLLKLRHFAEEMPEECYAEWSLSKAGNYYFYEYSKLRGKDQGEKATQIGPIIARGLGASPGVAVGRARFIGRSTNLAKLNPQDIAIVQNLGPEILGFITIVAAIISERGGVTSHGAILSREFGRPCVVQVPNVMSTIKEGMEIVVDGYRGTIMIPRGGPADD